MHRKLFFRKPPDGLLEICERVYVFDCCFTTDAWKEENYKPYVDGIIGQFRETTPDASIMVFNFREEETASQMANTLCENGITIVDYPRHYEGCPVLKMELIHHFLRSGESWLSLGQHNMLLMHCERGGWPVLSFMLAALLIYRKQYTGERRTLDMVYMQAPQELLHLLTPLNPIPSQKRYLQYVSRRNVTLDWPPLDRALTLDCIILRFFPNFDGEGGCRPIFRIYGMDPLDAGKPPKVLYSTPKKSKAVRAYKQAECELIKIDINCHIQGDIVIESINLNGDLENEQMIFRVMFNTAFIRSNILMLNRDEIDILWDAKDHFPKDFRAEILFSEMNAAAAVIADDTSCFEEKEGLPVEAFARVQEIFNNVDWLNPRPDVALNLLQHISASTTKNDKLDTSSDPHVETSILLPKTSTKTLQGKKNEASLEKRSVSSIRQSPDKKGDESVKIDATPELPGRSDVSGQEKPTSSEKKSSEPDLSSSGSVDTSSVSLSPRTPSPRPSLSRTSKQTLDSPSHMFPPPYHFSPFKPKYLVSEENEAQSEGKSQSSTLPNKFSTDSASCPSDSKTSTQQPSSPPVPPPSTPPLKKIPPVRTGSVSSSPQPPTPPTPPTPPLKEHKTIRAEPPPPPPPPPPKVEPHGRDTDSPSPQPPLKEEQHVRDRLPPPKSFPLKEGQDLRAGQLLPYPAPVKEEQNVRAVPLPTIPSSLKVEPHVIVVPPPPPPHPLKEGNSDRAGPPPPSPPPHLSVKAASPTTLPPPPPPPPAAAASSKHPNPSLENSLSASSAPAAPPPPIPPGTTGSRSSSPAGSKGRTLNSKNHQTKKLKPLHWLKLPRVVSGSLWAEAQKSGEDSKAPEIDMSELESLFSAAVPSSGPAKKSNIQSSVGPKFDKVQLIEHRRAYNCEIMLSKVKVPLHDLMSSVLELEESALDIDQVENLIKFCPTKEEMELLKGYTGEKEKLGRCEQFFLELMKVPRVESKLRVFSFKIQFHSQVSDIRKSLNIVNASAEEFRNSVKLRRIMQTILSLGNALNQGTARGSAIGFRLDSLLKLTETRARNNKMTLMHYLCKVLADKLPEVLDFSKDIANLEPAAKIQLKFLAEEMQAISKGLEKVVQELSTSENDGPISETFRKNLKEFLCTSEAEVRALASLYSSAGRNVDALILYFGEDPCRCTFEQVMSTLLNFTRMFNKAHEENSKQLELEMKKTSESEKKIRESERVLPTVIRTGNAN
ncbi:hypothetical protein L6164_011521 [Bauhinia variegata]|uniref:Uncharacterized protein n=1 Tax=Bauhinia variegata TaxID=167791 RepID=A0ACB9P6A6_BAUVA|nr:hypothetical protein L6164_011521 [Bauhinia variegata]